MNTPDPWPTLTRRIDVPKGTCSVDECENKASATGLCAKHYWRQRKYGSTELPPKPTECSVCGKPVRSRGLCKTHYNRLLRWGTTDDRENLHGSLTRYNKGCRCDPCVQKAREYRRDYYRRNPEKMKAQRERYRDRHTDRIKEARDARIGVATCKCGRGPVHSRAGYCKDCQRERNATPNAKAARRRLMLGRYGVTPEDYDAMLAAQGGACAICLKPEDRRGWRSGEIMSMPVDHDHATGAVRGLLCSKCNKAVGLFGDDPVRMRAAADYVSALRVVSTTA